MRHAEQFANDRPTSLNDDLYSWAVDAEELLRKQATREHELTKLLMRWCNDALSTEQVKQLEQETIAAIKEQL